MESDLREFEDEGTCVCVCVRSCDVRNKCSDIRRCMCTLCRTLTWVEPT